MTRKDKLKIEVFVPFSSCICDFTPFVEKVVNIASKFKDLVNIEMKAANSPEASKYGVKGLSVVVDGSVRLSADFNEDEIEEIIKGKLNEQ
ncbi:hypothetical protein KEJ27_07405 [Candidatus Bathyarchaeota archaeon]|nr:hypothetical protein [Candidatus Bathyarchaeota archaeon]